MKKSYVKRGLAVAIIFLFIGVALAPSITADGEQLSANKELVEITTEVYGINGVEPNTVKLTQEQATELDNLMKDIQDRLNNSKSREEAVAIFNDAIVSLDEFGLLGDLNVEEAQKLVAGGYQNPRIRTIIERSRSRNQQTLGYNESNRCLIAGLSTKTTFFGALFPISFILTGFWDDEDFLHIEHYLSLLEIWLSEHGHNLIDFLSRFSPDLAYLLSMLLSTIDIGLMMLMFGIIILKGIIYGTVNVFALIYGLTTALLIPISLGYIGVFGLKKDPAYGWCYTIDSKGTRREYKGYLRGNLSLPLLTKYEFQKDFPVGVVGFTGIKLHLGWFSEHELTSFYLGSARGVKIDVS